MNQPAERSKAEPLRVQAERFDSEYLEYDQRHANEIALEYRDRFYRKRLCNFELKNKKVLDAMCATGIDTPFLISRGANVCGLDISASCAALYEKRFQLECKVGSIHETGFDDETFDVVYVSGGLHHVSHMLAESLAEIHRILAREGLLCFVEPNADSWTDALRKLWYSRDDKFSDEERALSYRNELKALMSIGFEEEDYFTGGNVAYLVFQQSNVLKTPKFVYRYLKGPVFLAERIVDALPLGPRFFFCARWRKA